MFRKSYIGIIGIVMGLGFACNSKENCSKEVSSDVVKDINPNGSSELALLMETMFEKSKTWKDNIEKGEDLGAYPKEFDNLKTATPTRENVKNETFDPFADDFIRRTKELLEAKPDEQKAKFELLVDGCMNCHTTMCTGPVKRIKLLQK